MARKNEILFLGSGGADTTPRVGCACRVCQQARRRGGRYARNGPSLYLTRPSLLFDTPEDITHSLEREGIHSIRRLAYTHWHPDHTMGRRVLEQLNMSLFDPKARKTTEVWLPTWVREDFRKMLGLESHFEMFEKMGIAKIREIGAGEAVHIDGFKLRAYRMTQPGLTSFLLERGRKRIVLALDDTKNWRPGEELLEPDLLVMECGWFEHDPRGRQIVPEKYLDWLRGEESSFEETLELLERIRPKATVLTHIEEMNSRSYDDYVKLERKYRDKNIKFAYDGLRVAI